jgi:hypothetical protein
MGCFGGGQPEAPAAPTATSSMADYVANYPALFELQQKYAPQEAQQQVDLATQYAGQYGQALKAANDAMYPETSKLQEQLAKQASEGMQSSVPDWMQQQYRSNMNAQLGNNAASPIGSDYMSRGLLQQQQDWKSYYQNLGLSAAGRQPLTTAWTPQTTNQLSGYTANGVAGNNASLYGTSANIYGTQYQGMTANDQLNQKYIGMGLNGMGAMMSSSRYKRNIKSWLPHSN